MFQTVGKEATQSCVEGYHTCIFTYGQTGKHILNEIDGDFVHSSNITEFYDQILNCVFHLGSGKTFTIQGATNQDGSIDEKSDDKGLIPRVFEYLFYLIEEKKKNGAEFLCKCSYLEIYNETITGNH